jgi:hypothetical protein
MRRCRLRLGRHDCRAWVGMLAIAPGVCEGDRTTNLDATGLCHKGCYQPLATQDLSSWRRINRDRP